MVMNLIFENGTKKLIIKNNNKRAKLKQVKLDFSVSSADTFTALFEKIFSMNIKYVGNDQWIGYIPLSFSGQSQVLQTIECNSFELAAHSLLHQPFTLDAKQTTLAVLYSFELSIPSITQLNSIIKSFHKKQIRLASQAIHSESQRVAPKHNRLPRDTKNHSIAYPQQDRVKSTGSMPNPDFLKRSNAIPKLKKSDELTPEKNQFILGDRTCEHGKLIEQCPSCSSWGSSYSIRQDD